MTAILNVQKSDAAWALTLNNAAKRNALSSELVETLITTIEQAHACGVPLIVFRGDGKNFSAGFDFTDYESQSDGDLFLRFVRIEQLLQLVARSPAMTIAYAHGRNFGAGVDLFSACKWRYCNEDASFRMPGLKFGLVLGSRRFLDIVGAQHALPILSSTRTFHAAEAKTTGFVHGLADEVEFEKVLSNAIQMSASLGQETLTDLHRALDMDEATANADLAALVNSAARPGLKNRIRAYLDASAALSKTTCTAGS